MRGDVQDIFKMTPHDKQVMMFSATLSKEIRPICKKFMNDVSVPRRAPPPAAAAAAAAAFVQLFSLAAVAAPSQQCCQQRHGGYGPTGVAPVSRTATATAVAA
jgi:hypothetical protein